MGKLANYENPNSFGSRMRTRRLAPLIELIRKVNAAKGGVRILDVGGRETYWRAVDASFFREMNVRITILNLPSDLSGEPNEIFDYAIGDACDLSQYQDDEFDIVHSNSVIEHVGNWDRVKAFARETSRVAPNLFIQTPYFWFPVEPHFIKPFHHWLPKSLRVSMWLRFRMGERGRAKNIDQAMTQFDDEPYLLDRRMYEFLYPDCRILRERFLLLTKSMIAYRRKI